MLFLNDKTTDASCLVSIIREVNRAQTRTLIAAVQCQVCKAEYITPLPSSRQLLSLVRGASGASLTKLLQPGALLVAHDLPLNEDALAHAPAWLQWILRRKRAHWEKSVYLITAVIPGGSGDGGDDRLVGVNITRVGKSEKEEGEEREENPEVTRSIASSSDDDLQGEEEGTGEDAEDDGEETNPTRPRPRRRIVNIPSSENSSSSESEGPDGPIQSPPRTTQHAKEDGDDDEEDNDDTLCDIVRNYIGGPVNPSKRVLVHLTRQLMPSTATAEVPLDRESDAEASGAMRAFVYHQEDGDAEDYVDEIIGEAVASALADQIESAPQVHIFKGHARWSRSQLMNEIARGDWGLCLATPEDLTSGWIVPGETLWRNLYNSGRPLFAKVEDA